MQILSPNLREDLIHSLRDSTDIVIPVQMAAPTPPVALPRAPQDPTVTLPAAPVFPPTVNNVLAAIQYRQDVNISRGV